MSGMSGRWTDQRIRCEKLAEGRRTEEDDVKNEQNGRTKEYDVKNEQKVDVPRKTICRMSGRWTVQSMSVQSTTRSVSSMIARLQR